MYIVFNSCFFTNFFLQNLMHDRHNLWTIRDFTSVYLITWFVFSIQVHFQQSRKKCVAACLVYTKCSVRSNRKCKYYFFMYICITIVCCIHIHLLFTLCKSHSLLNRINGIMGRVLASSVMDQGVKPWSGQTIDYKIGICCFSVSMQH